MDHRPVSPTDSNSKDLLKVRRMAWRLLDALQQEQAVLDSLLDQALLQHPDLNRKDRALLHALVFGVLRWQRRLDHVIDSFSRTPLPKIDPSVLNLLRLALFQIIHLDRIPTAAAVDTAVELVKSNRPIWVVRYVNAVLRRAAERFQTVTYPDLRSDPVAALSIQKSFPEWMVRRWLKRYGRDETLVLCDWINRVPPTTLRVNRLKTSRENLQRVIQPEVDRVASTRFAPDGLALSGLKKPLDKMAAYRNGWFQVQDEAAQLISLILNPSAGKSVLDACAGLGGKTGHMAQLMGNRGKITAMDRVPDKISRLTAQMQRLGVTIVEGIIADLNRSMSPELSKAFDGILLDAPCSGMGVLRRNPDSKWRLSEAILKEQAERQISFLERLAPLVKLSGHLVYAVCSMEPEEGPAVATAFLKQQPEFAAVDIADRLPVPSGAGLVRNGQFRTEPHRHDMDGFFSVCLRRLR